MVGEIKGSRQGNGQRHTQGKGEQQSQVGGRTRSKTNMMTIPKQVQILEELGSSSIQVLLVQYSNVNSVH